MRIVFLLIFLGSMHLFAGTVVYQAFSGSSTPVNWQISGVDDDGAKDDTDFFNSGQGFLRLTKEANNEVSSAFFTGNDFNNVNWTLTAEVNIAAGMVSQDGEGLTICLVNKSLVDAQYATDGNYDFLRGALGPFQGAPTNLNLLGFEFDHLYNPGDSKSNEYAHVISIATTSLVHLSNGAKDFSNQGSNPNTDYYLNNGWFKIKLVCWQDGSDVKLTFWWTKESDGGTFTDTRKWEYNYTANGFSYPSYQAYLGITAATNTNKRASHDIRKVYLQNTADITLPVELSDFEALCVNNGIKLEWATYSEQDNAGFIIHRQEGAHWKQIAHYTQDDALKGQGTCTHASHYQFLDESVQDGHLYSYRLSSVSLTGDIEIKKQLTIEHYSVLPNTLLLFHAYPNPFNPSTRLGYQLTNDTDIELAIYNIYGQKVRTLATGRQTSGLYEMAWDGKGEQGEQLPSGCYFARLKTESEIQTIKLMLIK